MNDEDLATPIRAVNRNKEHYGITTLPWYEQPFKDVDHNRRYGLTYIGGITAATIHQHLKDENLQQQMRMKRINPSRSTEEIFLYTNHYGIPPLEDLINNNITPPVLDPQGLPPNTTQESRTETLKLLLDDREDLKKHMVYRSLFAITDRHAFEQALNQDQKRARIIDDKYVIGDTILTPKF
ncbi:hypothetical protein KY327_03665 [Candidatus Woesearchaeota archaeon]|nr:hypothetical protein [Candidatus Woesearchaeota archaeon]